jgi:hypothetical protein
MHTALPLKLTYRPASHAEQFDDPDRAARRPAGHALHSSSPAPSPKRPCMSDTH